MCRAGSTASPPTSPTLDLLHVTSRINNVLAHLQKADKSDAIDLTVLFFLSRKVIKAFFNRNVTDLLKEV